MRSLFVTLLFVLAARPLAAQCDGKIVSSISVVPHDPSFAHLPKPLRAIARGVGVEHTTTRAEVVSRFLLVEVGRPCSITALLESQRILRVQPFLAGATVRAVPDSLGGTRIEVETIDEIPTIFSMRLRHWRPEALVFGNGNIGGRALLAAVRLERGFAYRTGVGAQLVAYQVFRRPYTFAFTGYRAPLGYTLTASFGHAFLTDRQRLAWHLSFSDGHAYASFTRPDSGALALGVVRSFAAAGSTLRIGTGRRTGFLGGLVTLEDIAPDQQAVTITDSGLVAAPGGSLGGPFAGYRNSRLNAVVGVRTLSFLEVRGFDGLAAVQDVARGLQFGAIVGRGNDTFLSGDLYAGLGSARAFAALRVEGEARYDPGARRWDSMVASGRAAWYVKPSDAQVVIISQELAGGWRMRLPFALTLGTLRGGVRGYHDSRVAGAVRSVSRLEHRWSLGQFSRHVGFGLASFADAGMMWAGAAPFGVTSGVKAGLGAGLLVAIPAQSKRMWRLDFAVPVSPDQHARWEFRLTTVWAGGFWSEPSGVTQARAGAAPSLIFTWP